MSPRAQRDEPSGGDGRRLVSGFLSSLYPGLGQLTNRQPSLALLFALPITVVLAGAVYLLLDRRAELLAALFRPDTLLLLLLLNLAVLALRLAAVAQAFTRGGTRRVGAVGAMGLVVLLGWTLAPQAVAGYLGLQVRDAASAICVRCVVGGVGPAGGTRPFFPGDDPGSTSGPVPLGSERMNILLLGIDSSPARAHALTDTMIVASLDPVGRTVSMLSIPRDMVDVPLPNGLTYAPKLNTLLAYVNRNRDDPDFAWAGGSGTRALQDAIGTLVGIEIHYYAKVNLPGFVRVIDAVGGVDVTVRRVIDDPEYRAYGVDGYLVQPGLQHMSGGEALAYARVRRSLGESDFTRARRQQEVLVGLRNAALADGAVGFLGRLDGLLRAVRGAVRTDVPPERFSDLAFLAEQVGDDAVTRSVIRFPLVRPSRTPDPRGSIQIPDVAAIRAVAAGLFSAPGTPPQPWPSPRPSGQAATP